MITTRPTLLAGIKKGDNVSWYQFRNIYRPLIFHCAEQAGVPASDFLELEQEVLITFFKACENFEYNPGKGKFRTYFGTLVRNCIAQLRRNRQKDNRTPAFAGDSFLENSFERYWDEEWKQHIFWLSLIRARSELPKREVEIFELCDIKGVAPAVVASSLKISLATVYNYRKRVLKMLRKYVNEQKAMEEQEK